MLTEYLPPIFLRSYFARALQYSDGYGGFDGLVMGNMAETLNFKIKPKYLSAVDGYSSKCKTMRTNCNILSNLFQTMLC